MFQYKSSHGKKRDYRESKAVDCYEENQTSPVVYKAIHLFWLERLQRGISALSSRP